MWRKRALCGKLMVHIITVCRLTPVHGKLGCYYHVSWQQWQEGIRNVKSSLSMSESGLNVL